MSGSILRYHPLLVALHWAVAVLIIANLAGGKLLLEGLADSDPEKLAVLRLHMMGGLTILLLLLMRLVTRFSTPKPGRVHQGRALHWAVVASHTALYAAALAMAVTGLGMAQLAGLFPLLEGQAVTLPRDWSSIAPHAGHELFSTVLIGLIALHAAGAFYHAMRNDGVMGRMWFGQRKGE